jgi:L-ascorbate metabolism protein UlaG (beta-lactamase superfamily)
MLEVGAFHPAWSNIHLGPANALKAHALLGGGALLPIHWGTFNLALHPWDEPIETLLRLAPATGARVLAPRLGEPIEPSHDRQFETWWRGLDARVATPAPVAETELPKEMPWPID